MSLEDYRDYSHHLAHILESSRPKNAEPTEVRREAQDRSKRLFASYDNLRAILERHEATIQRRWTKKTRAKRQAILLIAWPDMPAIHRPDFDAWKKEPSQGSYVRDGITKYRHGFLLPFVNQEDLASRPKSLPLLLNSRGRHDPWEFAAADGDAMYFGKVTDNLRGISLPDHVMILNGATSPQKYGELLAFGDHPDAWKWTRSRKQFMPGEGLLILEAQEKLLCFLVNCCKQILHEIPEDAMTGDAFPINPEPHLKAEAETTGFGSLAVMAAEAPYRVPARLDLSRLQSLLSARKSAAEDHLWSLREDPGYFARTMRELEDHRPEVVKDTGGNSHPLLAETRKNSFRGRVIGNMVADAYLPVETFSELQRQAEDLRALQAKYAAAISTSEDLPKEYLRALVKFRYYVSRTKNGALRQIELYVRSSPPLRSLFVREPPESISSRITTLVTRPGLKMGRIENDLFRLLLTLWDQGQVLFVMRLPMVMDELERLLDAEPEAKQLISRLIADIIGDLSIMAQCITQIDMYHPWANGFQNAETDFKEGIESEFTVWSSASFRIVDALGDSNLASTQVAKLGDISGGRFAYPIEKRRTKDNVEILRRSEGNLDAFWASVDQLMHTKAGNLDGSDVQRLLTQLRILQRTPEWVEPVKEPVKKEETLPTSERQDDVDALNKPLSALYFVPLTGSSKKPDQVMPKTKTKTRGTTESDTPITAEALPEIPDPIDQQPTMPVDARALKVFRTLFFSPSPTAMPGEVQWNDFLHAMASTGFTMEKLYGSVWQFSPTTLDLNRSIQFHEPHPHGKMPFTTARRFGRRLNRAYGWGGSMFTLKEKQ